MHLVFNVKLCLLKTKCIFMISYFRIVISIPLSHSSPGFSVYLHPVLSPRTHNIPSAAAVSLPVKLQNVDLSLEYTLQVRSILNIIIAVCRQSHQISATALTFYHVADGLFIQCRWVRQPITSVPSSIRESFHVSVHLRHMPQSGCS